jgi:hypothetical protein
LTYAPALQAWLRTERVLEGYVGQLATELKTYLLQWVLRTPEDGDRFLRAVPLVIAHCDDDIYEDEFVAAAYGWVHLLERYRRVWFALLALFEAGRLPLARAGLEVLDVGTGPAPVLYALTDFHTAVAAFAEEGGIKNLKVQPPRLSCVEESGAMTHLMHVLSEIGRRPHGPFWADFRDIADVLPEGLRRNRRAFEVDRVMEEDDIGDERVANRIVSESGYVDRSFRYRFAMFSNFLTTADSVDRWHEPLVGLAQALYPGGLMVVMGAAGGSKYEEIYADLAGLMTRAGLDAVDDLPAIINSDEDPSGLEEVKDLSNAVWRHLTGLGVADVSGVEAYPWLWDPQTSARGKRFAIRAFRRPGRF